MARPDGHGRGHPGRAGRDHGRRRHAPRNGRRTAAPPRRPGHLLPHRPRRRRRGIRTGRRGTGRPLTGEGMDITEEILTQHHTQRRMFALLDEIDPSDTAKLGDIWHRLATFLEVHAAAEETYFYPRLLQLGRGAPGDGSPVEETEDAIKDHNEIRDAIADAARHAIGTDGWWR